MDWLTNLLVSNMAETIAAAVAGPLMGWLILQAARTFGWQISAARLQTLETAASNRAGLFVNALRRKAQPSELVLILAELAVDMLKANPKAAKGAGMTAEQAADKILAKVPQIAPDVIVPIMPARTTGL